MHLDLTDLRLFAMIADAGSITAGGERGWRCYTTRAS
jgi:hypothetical protein